jgi:glycosyltransferase involved in cell wall biosynthesis
MHTRIALAHDYLTQRGGAERVVLSMARAFPGAPLYTSLYDPAGTFPAFAEVEVRTLAINRIAPLRRHHRAALPLLPLSFSRLRVDADVVLCSSSGWAHGLRSTGRVVVYCHTPARWLYQTDRYLRTRARADGVALAMLRPALVAWDRGAARRADVYLTASTVSRERIQQAYGIDAEVLGAPVTLGSDGPTEAVSGLEPGFLLCTSRLLPYKNVDVLVQAVARVPGSRLVVVGAGPDERRLRAMAGPEVTFLGMVDDAQLRWLYSRCAAVVSASHEDYGLTPLEAAAFAKPVAVLRWGGFLDTVIEGRTGVFFDRPEAECIAAALQRLLRQEWDAAAIRAHAGRFSEDRFMARLREVVARVADQLPTARVA